MYDKPVALLYYVPIGIVETAIGYIPREGTMNFDGLSTPVNSEALFSLPKDFWLQECKEIEKYFSDQVPQDLPNEIGKELKKLEERVKKM
ncbi:phosphoenolpyruvate carboxykinase, mitochondrial [Trichonephila clavipes]|nr:phosphoenolpyruvate carboxykinase, mitochondrial [Trichonephila clavipes]